MTATTSSLRTRARNARKQVPMKVGAAKNILSGVLSVVAIGTGGLEMLGTLTSKYFAGVTAEAADNTSGAIGDKVVPVYTDGEHQFTVSGTFTQAYVGKPAYAKDNQTVLVGALSTGRAYVGVVTEYISATKAMIDISKATFTGVAVV